MSDKKLRTLAEIFAEDFQSTFPFQVKHINSTVFHCIGMTPEGTFIGWNNNSKATWWEKDSAGWVSLKPKKKIVIEAWLNVKTGVVYWEKKAADVSRNFLDHEPTGITLEAEE